jgi:glycosyltransferase involved in cell wall biosynthesis
MPLVPTFELLLNFLKEVSQGQAKKELGIHKPVITCGHSAAVIHQHDKIIRALDSLKDDIREFHFLFPMTQGYLAQETRNMVRREMAKTGLEFTVLDTFLTTREILAIRRATDIYIHLIRRDQMSGSMLEHLASGSVVITGKWLPYDLLEEKGVFFIRISRPEELNEVLPDVIRNLEEYREKASKNTDIIMEIMGWKNNRQMWLDIYGLN